jgi:hypothetical protein
MNERLQVTMLLLVPPSLPLLSSTVMSAEADLDTIIAIITAGLALLTVIAAAWALAYARDSAVAAKAAVTPLDEISEKMKESARLQSESLESARQLLRLELLFRRTTILEKVVTTIAVMAQIPQAVNSSDDPEEAAEMRFTQEKGQLIIELGMLPDIQLPECRIVARSIGYDDARSHLSEASEEGAQALTKSLKELRTVSEATIGPAQPAPRTEQPTTRRKAFPR